MTFRRPRPVSRAIAVILVGVAMMVLLAPASGIAGGPHAGAPAPSRSPAPIPLPPIHVRLLAPVGATIDPTAHYTSEPAPMGIGDFGVGAGGNPYTYNTTEFLGNFSWDSLAFSGSGGTDFTDQLNVVLQFVHGGTTYAYWIQDVAFMDSATNDLGFENNIWNFSSTSYCLDSSGVVGNGTVTPYSGCEGYYAVSPDPSLPGSSLTMPDPGDFGLLVRSYLASGGTPAVAFEYWDGVTRNYVTYDNAVFPWATSASSDPGFVVDGFSYNPGDLYYDAELTLGGPGGGAATTAGNPTHAASRLLYWNGHNLEAPPSVWNFGSNTAEAVSDLQSVFGTDAGGLPETVQLNGTTHNATPDRAYDQDRVGLLSLTAPGVASGTVAVGPDAFDFVDDAANLTLAPGSYPVWVNSTGGHVYLGRCVVAAGTTILVSLVSGCGPAVSTPSPSRPSVDVGQPLTFSSTLESPGSGGDSYAWQTSPSGLGCAPSTGLSLSCDPTVAGTYRINVTVTDSGGASSTSGNRTFTVDPLPSAPVPTSAPATAETGGAVAFSETPSGGATPYRYAWSGLPSPCSGTTTSEPTCTPSTAGTYDVSSTVTDANGALASSPVLVFTVSPGPSVSPITVHPGDLADVGQSLTFSTQATGGTGGYTFAWTGLPAGCPVTKAAQVQCTASSAGPLSVTVTVTDAGGGSASSSAPGVTIDPDPVVRTIAVAPAPADLGESLRFSTVGVSGGTGSYRYLWEGLPAGCVSANTSSITCAPTSPGNGTARVVVVDSVGGNATATSPYSVLSDPEIGVLRSTQPSVDVGEDVTFLAGDLTGGTGLYSYRWTGLPTGCGSVNASSVSCAPTAAGATRIELVLTDSNGISTNRSFPFTVDPAPAVGLPGAAPTSVAVGSSVTFRANVSGGSGPYSYVWTGLPTGCAAANRSTITCSPSAAGTFPVSVSVTDSNGVTVSGGTLAYIVQPASAPSGILGLTDPQEAALLIGIVVAVVAAGLGTWAVRRRRREGPPPPGPLP